MSLKTNQRPVFAVHRTVMVRMYPHDERRLCTPTKQTVPWTFTHTQRALSTSALLTSMQQAICEHQGSAGLWIQWANLVSSRCVESPECPAPVAVAEGPSFAREHLLRGNILCEGTAPPRDRRWVFVCVFVCVCVSVSVCVCLCAFTFKCAQVSIFFVCVCARLCCGCGCELVCVVVFVRVLLFVRNCVCLCVNVFVPLFLCLSLVFPVHFSLSISLSLSLGYSVRLCVCVCMCLHGTCVSFFLTCLLTVPGDFRKKNVFRPRQKIGIWHCAAFLFSYTKSAQT